MLKRNGFFYMSFSKTSKFSLKYGDVNKEEKVLRKCNCKNHRPAAGADRFSIKKHLMGGEFWGKISSSGEVSKIGTFVENCLRHHEFWWVWGGGPRIFF